MRLVFLFLFGTTMIIYIYSSLFRDVGSNHTAARKDFNGVMQWVTGLLIGGSWVQSPEPARWTLKQSLR